MDCSLPGFSVHEISQARILGWVAISFSTVSSWPRDWTHVSCIGRQVLYHWATWEAPQPVVLNVRMMLNVSFLPLLFKVIAVQSHISRFDIDLNTSYWNILFWTPCFCVYPSFPITIFPEGPKFPLATVHFFFCGHQSCSDSSIPFLLLEATGSGLSIISALLGVKGKVASFSRLLGQQTHISYWSIRAASIVGHVLLCLPAAVSTADLHPSSCYVQWPGHKGQSQGAQERREGEWLITVTLMVITLPDGLLVLGTVELSILFTCTVSSDPSPHNTIH